MKKILVLGAALFLMFSAFVAPGVGSAGAASAAPRGSGASAQPFDHQGCTSDICINVQSQGGKGPYIIVWQAYSRNTKSGNPCSTTHFWGGGLSANVNSGCAAGFISSAPTPQLIPRFYNNGTQLCVSNTVWPGTACATVES